MTLVHQLRLNNLIFITIIKVIVETYLSQLVLFTEALSLYAYALWIKIKWISIFESSGINIIHQYELNSNKRQFDSM